MPRGLQLLLPSEWPSILIRQISDFADWECPFIGQMVRLSLLGTLHDAFVVEDGQFVILVLVKCGASLRVPRDDVGGLTWEVEVDGNPHSLNQLSAQWFTWVTSTPDQLPIESIDVHPIDKEEELRDDELYGLGRAVSCHRRVRCFEKGESIGQPSRPPHLVYVKLVFPYLNLLADMSVEGYMREAAAYSILSRVTPAVAPLCYHANFNESTGSYASVLQDLVEFVQYRGTITETYVEKHTGATVTDVLDTLPDAIRIVRALASLHGTFLVDFEDAHSPKAAGRSSKRKAVRSAMLHEQIFYTNWAVQLKDGELRNHLANVFGCHPSSSDPPKDDPNGVPEDPHIGQPQRRSRLTFIHGCLISQHVLLHPDPRLVPGCLFVDWKASGIGPLEVDLIQLYLTLPEGEQRKTAIFKLLEEYLEALKIFFGTSDLSVIELLCHMRDTTLMLMSAGPFDWNGNGRMKEALAIVHKELVSLTTKDELFLLRERQKGSSVIKEIKARA